MCIVTIIVKVILLLIHIQLTSLLMLMSLFKNFKIFHNDWTEFWISSLGERVTRETGQPLPPPNAGSLNRENLRMVTQVLALALQGR